MAIIKKKTLESGVEGEYWVAESHNDKRAEKTNVLMLLFKDKDARDTGMACLLRENAGQMDGTYHTGEEVYTWVKRSIIENDVETNWFYEAEDLI
jgi:hypothetical protein